MAGEMHPKFEQIRAAARAGNLDLVDSLTAEAAEAQLDAAAAFDRYIAAQRDIRDQHTRALTDLSGTLEAIRGMSRS